MREEVLLSQTSAAGDARSLVKRDALATQNGYGLPAGDLNVAALVCVATFDLDKGEAVSILFARVSHPKAVASIIEEVWRVSND